MHFFRLRMDRHGIQIISTLSLLLSPLPSFLCGCYLKVVTESEKDGVKKKKEEEEEEDHQWLTGI